MLSNDEVTAVVRTARAGSSGLAIEIMRHLARLARIGDIAEVIGRYHESVEINHAPVRRFLASQVPGILSNHYFPNLGKEIFEEFIDYSGHTPNWSQPIVDAATRCDATDLAAAVGRTSDALRERLRRKATGIPLEG
jgi:hypothetical protein